MRFFPLTYMALLALIGCNGGDGPSENMASSQAYDVNEYTYDFAQCGISHSALKGSEDPLLVNSWHFSKIGMPADMALTGKGVTVAVSDNGTEFCHEDLKDNIILNLSRNYLLDDPTSWRSDPIPAGISRLHAHGTAVAGIIGASSKNGLGSRGVSSEASIVPFRYVGTRNTLDRSIDQANGPFDIFNYSYGRSSCKYHKLPKAYLDQLKYGATHLRGGRGAFYVKAAGNDFVAPLSDCIDIDDSEESRPYFGNTNMESDNNSPYMIIVGAHKDTDQASSYSTPGSNLWVSAPGGEYGFEGGAPAIIAPDLMGCNRGFSRDLDPIKLKDNNEDCKYTEFMNGTSSAAPIVSGVIALMLEQNKNLELRDVKDILAQPSVARKIDTGWNMNQISYLTYGNLRGHTYDRGWLTNAAGFHFNNRYGFGALDVNLAIKAVKERTHHLPPMQETGFISSPRTNLPIPDASALGVEDIIDLSDINLKVESVQIAVTIMSDDGSRVPQDIGIELTSPSGTISQILYINSGIVDLNMDNYVFLSNAFYGESSKGNWKIKVIDGYAKDTGVLVNWKINIFGHDSNATGRPIQGSEPVIPTPTPTPDAEDDEEDLEEDITLEDIETAVSSSSAASPNTKINKVDSKITHQKKLTLNQRRMIFPAHFKYREKGDVYQENQDGHYLVVDNSLENGTEIFKVENDGEVLASYKIFGKETLFHDVILDGEDYVLVGRSRSLVFDIDDIERTNFTHTIIAKLSSGLGLIKGQDIFANKESAMAEKVKTFKIQNKTLTLVIEKDGIPKETIHLEVGGLYE